MTYRSGVVTGAVGVLLLAGAAGAGWRLWTSPPSAADKHTPPAVPATVPTPFKEDKAAGITLTPEGETRLALKVAAVERRPVGRVRVYGGEVMVPSGQAVVVTAPLAGILRPAGETAPVAGLTVKAGQPMFQLHPILDPIGKANLAAARVDAQGQIDAARETVKGAQIGLDRAKKVMAGGAGTARLVDEAQVAVDLAGKQLAAAEARKKSLDEAMGMADSGTAIAVAVTAPEDGVLRQVSALGGQTVSAGQPLFEVVDLGRVWVRVPVYVGDLADIDPAAPAAVGPLTARPGDPTRPATPVTAPPAANPAAGTTDLFFALDNRETKYSPGQRVGATLALKGPADGLVVPAAAVVYDIHGGGWVYERTGDRTFTRRRVVVRYVAGADAVLAVGPAVGTPLVTAGAAELFGTETGFSK